MPTVLEKAQQILQSKASIKTALQNKGQSPTNVFSTYNSKR